LILLILLIIAIGTLHAENMWQSHGVNFSYVRPGTDQRVSVFPVVWDIRSTGNIYREYCDVYDISPSVDPVMELLTEAAQSGFNAAMMRSELWVIDVPGDFSTTNYIFEEIADAIRATGMDIIVGGFWTNPYTQAHNMATMNYLADYVEQTAQQYTGDVIGVFGFDEPAVKFLENPSTAWDWLNMVADYSALCESEIGLPILSFLSKFGTLGSGGTMYYYNDTTSVLNRFSRYLDVIAMNMYPIKNNDRRLKNIPLETDSLLFCGATDLLPSSSPYYEVYTDRDEFFSVTGGDRRFNLYKFICTPGCGHLEMEQDTTIELPFSPTGMAASDFRACDIGDRITRQNRLNGAVIFWDSSLSAGEETVLISDGQDIITTSLPEFPGSDRAKPLAFCVGQGTCQTPGDGFKGILGRGDTAILGCYLMDGKYVLVTVFGRNEEGLFQLETTYSLRKMNVDGVQWGRFWGDAVPEDGTPPMDGGFLIYNNRGSYVTCLPGKDGWLFYPRNYPYYSNLFGTLKNPVSVFVTHEDASQPPYTPGNDYISAVFQTFSPVFCRSRSSGSSISLDETWTTPLAGQGGKIFSAGSYRPDRSYGEVLLCTGEDGLQRSDGTITQAESEGLIQLESLGTSTGSAIFPGARVMYTRRNIRAGLAIHTGGLVLPAAELYWSEYDSYRLNWFTECFEVAMENGVASTPRNNCVFANIQSYGRHAFGLPSYCASQDTMLWMITVPVIKGCRGIIFYAMDLALMSGNRMESGMLRYPDLMQNWGPSRDVDNIDIPGRIHRAVASLTGNVPGGGPDFLSAMVDTNYRVLQVTDAVNCMVNEYSEIIAAPSDTTLNFIAVEDQRDGTILMLISNESGNTIEAGRGICFPEKYTYDYKLNAVDGFTPAQAIAGRLSPLPDRRAHEYLPDILFLDFSGMPPVNVSLIELRPAFGGSGPGNNTFLEVWANGGAVLVRFKIDAGATGELVLYDMAGRKVKTVWSGIGLPGVIQISLERDNLPAGIYFVTLSSGEYFISAKVTLLL